MKNLFAESNKSNEKNGEFVYRIYWKEKRDNKILLD